MEVCSKIQTTVADSLTLALTLGVILYFQQKNSDLERNLTSHKRNNEQLGNHVNEQVKCPSSQV